MHCIFFSSFWEKPWKITVNKKKYYVSQILRKSGKLPNLPNYIQLQRHSSHVEYEKARSSAQHAAKKMWPPIKLLLDLGTAHVSVQVISWSHHMENGILFEFMHEFLRVTFPGKLILLYIAPRTSEGTAMESSLSETWVKKIIASILYFLLHFVLPDFIFFHSEL